MTEQNAFLSKAEQLFELKDALTETMSKKREEIERETQKAASPKRIILVSLFGLAAVAGALLLPAAGALMLFVKGIAVLGSMALMVEAVNVRNAGTAALRSAIRDEAGLESHDRQNEAAIASLQKQAPFQPQDVQVKFAGAFAASAAKRKETEDRDAKLPRTELKPLPSPLWPMPI